MQPFRFCNFCWRRTHRSTDDATFAELFTEHTRLLCVLQVGLGDIYEHLRAVVPEPDPDREREREQEGPNSPRTSSETAIYERQEDANAASASAGLC